MKKLQDFMDEKGRWADATFGRGQPRSPLGPLHHLKQEIDELIAEIENYYFVLKHTDGEEELAPFQEAVRYEFADAHMLLLDAERLFGITAEMDLIYMQRKLEINKNRTWGSPDENGVINHIK